MIFQYVKELNQFVNLTIRQFENDFADVKVANLYDLAQTSQHHHVKNSLANWHIAEFANYCGGYRSRTDDPLRARQVL